MNKIADPYGVFVGMTEEVTEETIKKWRKESELFVKHGSELVHKHGFEKLEKMDNEPKYIEEPEEEPEEIMYSTLPTTSTAYLEKFFKEKKSNSSWWVIFINKGYWHT